MEDSKTRKINFEEKLEAHGLKKSELGVAGAIIVLSQLLTDYRSSSSMNKEFKNLETEFFEMQENQKKHFVTKEEFRMFVNRMDRNLNKISQKIDSLKK